MSQIVAAMLFAPVLHELNKPFRSNKDEYPVLNTDKTDPESWWNSLRKSQKFEVGSCAVHYSFMKASYCFDMTRRRYSKLKKSQQKIIKQVFAVRDNPWNAFNLAKLLGL